MLPSKGYFASVICPHNRECPRPYCHFRHKYEGSPHEDEDIKLDIKQLVDKVYSTSRPVAGRNNVTRDELIGNSFRQIERDGGCLERNYDVPSYNPTPISQLNKRHIPVPALPDKPNYSVSSHRPKTLPAAEPQSFKQPFSITDNSSGCGENRQPVTDKSLELEELQTVRGIEQNFDRKESIAESCHSNRLSSKNDPNSRVSQCKYLPHDLSKINNPDLCQISSKEEKSTHNRTKNDISSFENQEQDNMEVAHRSVCANEGSSHSNKTDNIGGGKECSFTNMKTPLVKSRKDTCSQEREKRKLSSNVEYNKKVRLEIAPAIDCGPIFEKCDPENQKPVWNLPLKEDERNEFTFNEQFPPLKKLKGCNSSSPDLLVPPNEKFCGKWERLNKMITSKRSSSQQMRINPVPNVQMYFAEKPGVFSRNNRLFGNQSTHLQSHGNPRWSLSSQEKEFSEGKHTVKTIVRKAHVTANNIQYPTILSDLNSRIPHSIRQISLNKMFEEFSKYLNDQEAKNSAQRMEWDTCKRVHTIKPYKNAIAMALLRIRKFRGVINENEKTYLDLKSDSVPPYTNGWTLYKCFSQYILSEEEYKSNGFPIQVEGKTGYAFIEESARRNKGKKPSHKYQRCCDHCSQTYFIDERGFPLKEYDCTYHWGKLRRSRFCGSTTERYSCCDGEVDAEPCTTGRYHVYNAFDEDSLEGFVSTHRLSPWLEAEKAGIYGLDCEMCYTTNGIELTRCTLVDLNGTTVYDKIVVPNAPVIDYCTRFSGITEDILRNASLTLEDIQKDIIERISDKTILVGHSLENDLKVLRIFHRTVVDTSVVFPHNNGLPFKNSLKRIAKDLINLSIQESESGHDSSEDANACVQLMLWKVKEDGKRRKPRTIIGLEPRESRRGE